MSDREKLIAQLIAAVDATGLFVGFLIGRFV